MNKLENLAQGNASALRILEEIHRDDLIILHHTCIRNPVNTIDMIIDLKLSVKDILYGYNDYADGDMDEFTDDIIFREAKNIKKGRKRCTNYKKI